MVFLAAQRYGCVEEYEAAGSPYVPIEGLSFGEFFNLVPLNLVLVFFFLFFFLLISWNVFVAFALVA